MLQTVFGVLLIVTGIGDAIKYSLQAIKIKKLKSAKAMSRKFINLAILNDIVKLGYGVIIKDSFIVVSSVLALVCMIHLFNMIYKYYPFRMRGCVNFKRPNIILYLINSLLPNRIRKRL